jgi:TonB family protein
VWGNPEPAKVNGTHGLCIPKLSGEARDQFCFDPQSAALLRRRGFEFFEYQKFGQFHFPHRVEITRPEMPPVEVVNIEITPEPLGAEVFRIPETMLAIESCEDSRLAKPVYMPEPEFPEAARKHKQQATVYISIIIGTDGNVWKARALNETRYEMGTAATKKVRTWKFRPATCGTRPVNF